MSGTYRTVLTYARDGFYGSSGAARKAADKLKKMDRRQARREAARAKREAMREYELEVHEDYEEMLSMDREECESDLWLWEELERERAEDEEREREDWERAERYHREMEMLDCSYEYGEWDY